MASQSRSDKKIEVRFWGGLFIGLIISSIMWAMMLCLFEIADIVLAIKKVTGG